MKTLTSSSSAPATATNNQKDSFIESRARPDQRLAKRYCFNDADMDLFFMAALGWGPTGGLDIG